METKRKMEEIERRRQEDEDLRAAVALQVRQIIENFFYFLFLPNAIANNTKLIWN